MNEVNKIDIASWQGRLEKINGMWRAKPRNAKEVALGKEIAKALHARFEQTNTSLTTEENRFIGEVIGKLSWHAPDIANRIDRWRLGLIARQQNISDSNKINNPQFPAAWKSFLDANPDFVRFARRHDLLSQQKRTDAKDLFEWDGVDVKIQVATSLKRADDGTWVNESRYMSWQELKENLGADALYGKMQGTHHSSSHVTQWGLLLQDNVSWETLTPICRLTDPPEKPFIQVTSYIPGKDLFASLKNQGHSGLLSVDSQGYVYTAGFYYAPGGDFNKLLSKQKGALRSPDPYEMKNPRDWREAVLETDPKERYNRSGLQFNFSDDTSKNPSLMSLLNTAETSQVNCPSLEPLKKALKHSGSITNIRNLQTQLHQELNQAKIQIIPLNKQQKMDHFLNFVTKTQCKLNGISVPEIEELSYISTESNCAHVARYHFGAWAEVMLGAQKSQREDPVQSKKDVLPDVPINGKKALRWKSLKLTASAIFSARTMRIFGLFKAIKNCFFQQKGHESSIGLKYAWKNLWRPYLTPNIIREEALQAKDINYKPSLLRRLYLFITQNSSPFHPGSFIKRHYTL